MKKLLVVLLAVVMVFGFASSAFAASQYTDVSGLSQDMQDGIAKLSALEVIEGYPDGTFGPAADITRAEFAKIACNLAGIGQAAENLTGTTSRFADVPSGSWFTGWVNLAAAQGFVNGYPDGTFRPNSNITMQEVVTVLLRICGYDDNLAGPWPFDYISQASKLDITKGITFAATGNANRGDVALMSSNTLDQDIVYWDADKARFLDVTDNAPKTLLEESFKTDISKDVVLGDWTVTNYDKMTVTLQFGSREYKFASNYYITGGNFVNNVKDHMADVYYNDDNEIIFVDILSTATFYDKVKYDYTAASSSGSTTTAAYISNITIDGKKASSPNTIDAHENAYDFQNEEVYAKFFYNDDDELYKVNILATPSTKASNPIIVESATSSKITAFDNSAAAPSINNKQVVVIKNGEFAKVEDLAKGDIFFRKDDSNGVDEVIIVAGKKEGVLTKGTATKLTIDGTAYVYSQTASSPWTTYSSYYTDDSYDTIAIADDIENFEDAFDTTVEFVTADGNPFYVAIVNFSPLDDTTRLYGIVTSISADVSQKVSGLTIMNQNGSKVTYDIVQGDNTLRFIGTTADFNVDYGSYIEAKVSNDNSIDTDDIIMINDGISDYTSFGISDDSKYVYSNTSPSDVSSNRIKIGNSYYNVTSSTVVLNAALKGGTGSDFDKAELLDYTDITKSKEVDHDGIIAKIDGSNIVALAILNSGTSSSSNYGVLTNFNYSSKYYVDLVGGDTKIEVSNTTYTANRGYADTHFVAYNITSSKLAVNSRLAEVADITSTATYTEINHYLSGLTALPSGDDTVWVDPSASGSGIYAYGSDSLSTSEGNWLTVNSRSGNSISLTKGSDTRNYTLTSGATVFIINDKDGELVEGSVGDISKGAYVYAISTDEPEDYELDYVIVIEQK